MGGTGKDSQSPKNQPTKNLPTKNQSTKNPSPKNDGGKSSQAPPASTDIDDSEDGDFATPKQDSHGDDDQPL